MKDFVQVPVNIDDVRQELRLFRKLLDSTPELEEASKVLPFFRKNRHLAAFTGAFYPNSVCADMVAFEYSIYGDFVADLVLKDSKRHQLLLVEFEDGKRNSIFQKASKKYTPEWGRRLEHGYSQIVDWLWKLADMERTDDFASKFGKPCRYQALLVIGRDSYLDEIQRNRLEWRFSKTTVDTNIITCFTYDQLYEMYDHKLESIKILSVRRSPDVKDLCITNRWSSRLRGWPELAVLSRKEPRSLGVVGGAAQLYVMFIQDYVHGWCL